MSKDKSITIFVSRALSCSSSRSRFNSDGFKPAYFLRQLKKVTWLILADLSNRQIFAPRSLCASGGTRQEKS
ncbi:hypothetical protein IWQ55_003186 [Labrenzia sp. EL_208]|nr:hypothetical protein [Labrenzia sp. EL_132]MBG6229970.1 hypothetical protein [Labrenzia sp. EL_208]